MMVNELVILAADYFEGINVDTVIRAIKNTIRDVNGSFRGLHKSVLVTDEGIPYNDYMYETFRLTGTIEIEAAPIPDNPSVITGTNTLFETELVDQDQIMVNGTIYTVTNIVNDTNANTVEHDVEEDAGSVADKITDRSIITLTGLEKTILRVYVDGELSKEVLSFDQCSPQENAFMRLGYNRIAFRHIADDARVVIEGLFAIHNIENRTDSIEMPQSWEGILTNGLLFYISKLPKHRDNDAAQAYSTHYYQKLRDLATNTDVSLMTDYSHWNYAKARKD